MAVSKVPRPITVKWLGKTCEIIYKPAKVFTDEKLINSGLCLIARTLDTAGVENLSSCGPFMLVKKGMRAQEKDRGVEIRPGTNNCYEFWVFPENASPNQRTARKRFMKAHGTVFMVLGAMQWFWYSSDKRRERFVSICRDRDVQQMTWDSYMNKKLTRKKPAAQLRIFFKDLAHLVGLAPT